MLGVAAATVGHTNCFVGTMENREAHCDAVGFTVAISARIVGDHGSGLGRVEKSDLMCVGKRHMVGGVCWVAHLRDEMRL